MVENRFCFVAIVKNESHVIERCLDSIANIATSYLICDTGSVDGTPEMIENYMKNKNIPGEVIYKNWKDYGYNKSYLLEQAYIENKSRNAKYLIWHDADEVFLKDENNLFSYLTKSDADDLFNWLESRPESITYLKTIDSDLHYRRWNIVKNSQLYKWISPKHEWLSGTVNNTSNYYDKMILLTRHEGNASKDPLRCQKDVHLFLNYIEENGGVYKCPREVFYVAQEYESFDKVNSIKYYKLKTELPINYIQENYISFLRLGRLSETVEDKIKYWTDGFELMPNRLECIYEIVKHYLLKKDFNTAFKWGCLASEKREINDNDLFVEHNTYRYAYDLDFSMAAYYSGRYQFANDINQKNILRNKNTSNLELLLSNQKFIDSKLSENKLIKLVSANHADQSNHFHSGLIRLNNAPQFSIVVIDNFYPDPDSIREIALAEEFSVKGNYPGGRTKSFATDATKKIFENIIGKPIVYWPDQYNGSFQYTTIENKSWIHRDSTSYSAVIYLTPNAPLNSGTVIYQHRNTGLRFTNGDQEEKIVNVDSSNESAWDVVDSVSNIYNRCIIFNGKQSHKSNVYFGTNKYDGRLFQTFFFDV